MPTSTVENYLKTIFKLTTAEKQLVAIGQIAADLEVTPGTATTMMKQLEKLNYVDYQPRKGVTLTSTGHRTVIQVIRRHRILELFLVEHLNFDWSEVHEEAEVLEHAVSDRLINRMDEMLGSPTRDPHGDPIPDIDGVMRRDNSQSLESFDLGRFRLIRVTRTEPDFLEWLSEAGLRPGVKFELMTRNKLADVNSIRIEGRNEELHFAQSVIEHLQVVPAET